MSDPSTYISIDGKKYPLEKIEGTAGPNLINVGNLYADTGLYTYDPGFRSTAACESKITYTDGQSGTLLYRGYSIDDLAHKCDFLEVCYLLLNGELPNRTQRSEFLRDVTYHTMIHEQMQSFVRGFRRDAHPMAIMVGLIGAMSAFYHDSTNINDPVERSVASFRLIAKMPTIVALTYKYSIGQPVIYPRNDLDYTENFLHMCFSVPCEQYVANPIITKALSRIFILHADHEQNASTSTVRLAGSSGANPFACIAAGIACLWGPAHGGANQAALEALEEIGSVERIPEFIARAKDKNDPYKLMGFGHRVYKNYDPRAKIIQESAQEVLNALGLESDPLFKIARELEQIALTDEYFIKRSLYPNVDFYSGIILRAIGFPNEMFTPLFALARTAGWISQWKEMMETPGIGRPRQLYTGYRQRAFVELANRD